MDVIACWQMKNGKPVGRLHLVVRWTDRKITRCNTTSSAVEHPGWSWSVEPDSWPNLPVCHRCTQHVELLRRSFRCEIDRLDEFEKRAGLMGGR